MTVPCRSARYRVRFQRFFSVSGTWHGDNTSVIRQLDVLWRISKATEAFVWLFGGEDSVSIERDAL